MTSNSNSDSLSYDIDKHKNNLVNYADIHELIQPLDIILMYGGNGTKEIIDFITNKNISIGVVTHLGIVVTSDILRHYRKNGKKYRLKEGSKYLMEISLQTNRKNSGAKSVITVRNLAKVAKEYYNGKYIKFGWSKLKSSSKLKDKETIKSLLTEFVRKYTGKAYYATSLLYTAFPILRLSEDAVNQHSKSFTNILVDVTRNNKPLTGGVALCSRLILDVYKLAGIVSVGYRPEEALPIDFYGYELPPIVENPLYIKDAYESGLDNYDNEKHLVVSTSGSDDLVEMKKSSSEPNLSIGRGLPVNKRALLIGINYKGTSCELYGCINDATNVRAVLVKNYGYSEKNILLLSDTGIAPTKANILKGIEWLLSGSPASDFNKSKYLPASGNTNYFFHYSGHGSTVRDTSGDETDGIDETICPVDYSKSGMIVDDDLRSKLAVKIPVGSQLYAIVDACHSGTSFDLQQVYKGGALTTEKYAPTSGKVVMISGCRDNQTSADTWVDRQAQGALTASLLKTLKQANYNITYSDLIANTMINVRELSTQIPCLSFGKVENLKDKFLP